MGEADGFPEAPTVARTKLTLADGPATTYAFVIVEGPDAPRSFRLDPASPSRPLIGQSPSCDLRLSDPEVSRRHAALELVGRRVRITDLGSTNGTFVDGVAIGEAFLRGGEIVRVGATALRVEPSAAANPAPLTIESHFGRVLGESAAMRRLYPLCQRLAASNVAVVIEGETGTGKEQLAEALHELGPRADKPFVVLDCTSVASSL